MNYLRMELPKSTQSDDTAEFVHAFVVHFGHSCLEFFVALPLDRFLHLQLVPLRPPKNVHKIKIKFTHTSILTSNSGVALFWRVSNFSTACDSPSHP